MRRRCLCGRAYITTGTKRCALCQSAYAGDWPRIRAAVLERDGHACQINGPHCTGHATHADHIIPVGQPGGRSELSNLRAACAACNSGKHGR